jgi:hypothetical protein
LDCVQHGPKRNGDRVNHFRLMKCVSGKPFDLK